MNIKQAKQVQKRQALVNADIRDLVKGETKEDLENIKRANNIRKEREANRAAAESNAYNLGEKLGR